MFRLLDKIEKIEHMLQNNPLYKTNVSGCIYIPVEMRPAALVLADAQTADLGLFFLRSHTWMRATLAETYMTCLRSVLLRRRAHNKLCG